MVWIKYVVVRVHCIVDILACGTSILHINFRQPKEVLHPCPRQFLWRSLETHLYRVSRSSFLETLWIINSFIISKSHQSLPTHSTHSFKMAPGSRYHQVPRDSIDSDRDSHEYLIPSPYDGVIDASSLPKTWSVNINASIVLRILSVIFALTGFLVSTY